MSVTAYNQEQSDLKDAITNLNQKLRTIGDKDELQDIRRFRTTKSETHALYKKYQAIYTVTGIATIGLVLYTAKVVMT